MDDLSCISSTASERRRRALTNPACGRGRKRGRGDDIVLEEAPQILQNDVIDNGSGADDDAADVDQAGEEVLTGPFPGGPSDPSVLKSFKAHITAAIWKQNERNPSRCYNYASKILEWQWWSRTDNRRFRDIVQQSGLSSLVHCTYLFVNRIVISAFVKRWQPETNTFHLTVGEMTMTLDDVGTISRIPIIGRSISVATLTDQ
ncbi:protein MAIN-LIKE 1-like [Camellia sinensis]|uniref:protein MAIN-LIKE 1-like n=1 Tax=Camellia sinensis TaxID=4442 RepID=UPI001035A8A5|nr:protein MAIN-LIKE 1-like [Camellia sinensis]